MGHKTAQICFFFICAVNSLSCVTHGNVENGSQPGTAQQLSPPPKTSNAMDKNWSWPSSTHGIGKTVKETIANCMSPNPLYPELPAIYEITDVRLDYNYPQRLMIPTSFKEEERRPGNLMFEEKPYWTCLMRTNKCERSPCNVLPDTIGFSCKHQEKIQVERLCRDAAAEIFGERYEIKASEFSFSEERVPSLKSKYMYRPSTTIISADSVIWEKIPIWKLEMTVTKKK